MINGNVLYMEVCSFKENVERHTTKMRKKNQAWTGVLLSVIFPAMHIFHQWSKIFGNDVIDEHDGKPSPPYIAPSSRGFLHAFSQVSCFLPSNSLVILIRH